MTLAEPADSFSEPDVSKEKEKPPTAKKGNVKICGLDQFFVSLIYNLLNMYLHLFQKGSQQPLLLKKVISNFPFLNL